MTLKRWLRGLRARIVPNGKTGAATPAASTLFAVIAGQRSGTHLLRQIVNSNPQVALAPEPFSRDPKPAYWCNYVRTLPADQFPPLTPEQAMALLDEYVSNILQDIPEERDPGWYGCPKPDLTALGLDIKYNQLRGVTSLSMDLRSQPILLQFLRKRQFRIVHLVRKNVLHAAISLIIANTRNIWHNYDAQIIPGQYHIPWPELHAHMQWIKLERQEFVRLAADLPIHTCYYEDLVDDLANVDEAGQFSPSTKVLGPLAEMIGVANRFFYRGIMHKVINRPYAEILENFDELFNAVRNSEFEEFAESLGPVARSVAA